MEDQNFFISREQNPEAIPFCPVVHPTLKEFSDFNTYIEKLEKEYSHDYGMVKVVPPKNWKARTADYEKSLEDKMIIGPIEQNPYGKGGVYECIHIMKKSVPFKEYRRKALDFDKITDGKSVEKVEDMFWKNISFSPPLYGSDMQMSLFDNGVKWNLNELQSILNDGLKQKISGINTPYLYIGSWKTLFAWHKEDLDLGDDKSKLENFTKQQFTDSFNKCPQFLRHKTTVINPYQIMRKLKGDIKISKIDQREGEYIIVFSGAYHHGFNWGYNIAEAVNYASLSWLDAFPNSKQCHCASDNVNIDPSEFLMHLLKARPDLKNRGEVKRFKEWIKQKNQIESEIWIETVKQYEIEQQIAPKKKRKTKVPISKQLEEVEFINHSSYSLESSYELQEAVNKLPNKKKAISKQQQPEIKKNERKVKLGRPPKLQKKI